ncbi:hypothetical protein [Tsuneonella sp. HG222]
MTTAPDWDAPCKAGDPYFDYSDVLTAEDRAILGTEHGHIMYHREGQGRGSIIVTPQSFDAESDRLFDDPAVSVLATFFPRRDLAHSTT